VSIHLSIAESLLERVDSSDIFVKGDRDSLRNLKEKVSKVLDSIDDN